MTSARDAGSRGRLNGNLKCETKDVELVHTQAQLQSTPTIHPEKLQVII